MTTTSGAVTITLPTISTVDDGFKVAIVKWTGDANAVTVNRSSTNTINGATSATIGSQYSSTIFVADFETNQWFAASSGLGATNIAVDAFSGNGSTTAFTLSGDPGSENNTQVFVSGVYQEKDTYSVSGTTLTFSTAPPTGTSNIEVVWTAPLAIGTPSDGTVTTAKIASSVTLTTPTLSGDTTAGTINGLTVGKGGGAVSTNTAVGASALAANTSGASNVAIGSSALSVNTTASNNTAVGYGGLQYNITGTGNSALGYRAGWGVTSNYNTAIGMDSMSNASGGVGLTSGANNTAVGYQTFYSLTSGGNNTAVGFSALYSNTTASNNTALGYQAGYSKTTGNNNLFVGLNGGYSTTTGTNNSFVGCSDAGYYVTTGSKNTILGAYNGNQGGLDIRTASNYIVLSDGDGNPKGYFEPSGNFIVTRTTNSGIQSIGCYQDTTGSAANVFITTGGSFVRSTSSRKYKTDIQDATHGLADVLNLRSVTYKGTGNHDNGQVLGGLIAEEVHDAGLTEFVQYADDGTPDALAYGHMASLFVKAIQELKTIVDAQAAEIAILKTKVN